MLIKLLECNEEHECSILIQMSRICRVRQIRSNISSCTVTISCEKCFPYMRVKMQQQNREYKLLQTCYIVWLHEPPLPKSSLEKRGSTAKYSFYNPLIPYYKLSSPTGKNCSKTTQLTYFLTSPIFYK